MTGWMLGLAVVLVGLLPAAAQDRPDRARLRHRPPLRVDVTPGRLYRQCTDGYAIEHREAGDTVVPRMQCWWAVR